MDILGIDCPVKKDDPKNDNRTWEEILKEKNFKKVLYLYRDPRVTAILNMSLFKKNNRLQELSFSEMTKSMDKLYDCSGIIDNLKKESKEVYTLRYEDYLTDTEKVLGEISKFFNITPRQNPMKSYNRYLSKWDSDNNDFKDLTNFGRMFPFINQKYKKEILKWKYPEKISISEILKEGNYV